MSSSFQMFQEPKDFNTRIGDGNFTSKHRPIAEKRQRGNDYQPQTQGQMYFNMNSFTNARSSNTISGNSSNMGNQNFGQFAKRQNEGGMEKSGNTISMMSNRGLNIENTLRGYSRQSDVSANKLDKVINNSFTHQNVIQSQLLDLHINSNLNDTIPIHYNIPNAQGINPANYNYRLNDDQELLRRERIKEQNLQEKMLVVQKEQKISSEVAYSFKQMSCLLDACLKLDETGAGITSIKQNDLYLPHGSNFIQYKAIEFPKCIDQYYKDQLEKYNDDVAVNKGIITELSLAWVSINSKLFIWKYGPQSFASFTRIKDKNEYYKQNKDQYGTKRDEKIERDQVKEFDLEDTILFITYGQPKHAIFKQNEIKNVLVIAFPNQIKVKHIKLEHNNLDIQDINVTINTDHELVNKIIFSKKGRIFFGGSSGRVKYIDYFKQQILGFTISERFQAKEGVKWQQKFRQQIPLLNQDQQVIDICVDDTRQILYALIEIQCDKPFFKNPFSYNPTQAKTVQRVDVYDLGVFDEDFTFVGSLTHAQFCEQLLSNKQNLFHLLPTSKELTIVSISAVEKYQSNEYNFVVVTQSGIRAYYALTTKPVTDKKNQAFSAQETKESRERFQMFEKYRPIAEFNLKHIKGMIEISQQSTPFKNFHIFYDHKDYITSKGSCIQVDDDMKKHIKSAFSVRGGIVMQKIQNNQNRLIFIESNQCYIARLKENMFTNHQIFSEFHSNFSVATERIGEMVLDFQSRDENSNILSDLTFAQIPDKNLLPPSISGLVQLETSQMIGEQNGQQSFICLNDLAKQCFSPPSHYVVLTSKGILLNYQQRPIDILYQVIKVLPDYITEVNQSQAQLQYLMMSNGKSNRLGNQIYELRNNQQSKEQCFEFFEQFILTYGVTETFAMLSQMLCHSHLEYYQNLNVHNHLDKQLKSRLSDSPLNNTTNFTQGTQYEQHLPAKSLNAKPVDKPIDSQSIPETIITEISESIIKKAHFLFQKYGDILLDESSEIQYQQKNDQFQNTLGKAWEQTRRKYTSKVEGILLYFSRLIRPVWNKPLVNSYAFKFFVNEPIENFKREEIIYFTRRLNEFKFWLENETKVIYCNELKTNSQLGTESNQTINNIYMKNSSSGQNTKYGSSNRYKSNDEKMQEIKADEAKLIDDLLRFCNKIIQIANLFLFICENKLRSNLNNIEFKDLRDDILSIRFKDIFNDKKHEKTIKNYVLQAIKLDPKYMDQARLVLNQFNSIFHERDFNISQAEIKLQMILNKFSKTGVPEAKYLNECTNILLDHIEYLTTDYIERFYSVYTLLDSRVDFVKIIIECIKFHQRIMENIERQISETQALEEQLRAHQTYNPVNKYSEQLKIQKQILDDNSQQREFCLLKIIQILEELHKESEQDVKNKMAKDTQITNIIKIIKNYPFELVHASLIEFLLRNKRKNEILELNSPFTEQIFSTFGNDSAECLKIKFKYLEQIGNIKESYNIAFQLSNFKNREDQPEERVLLDDRIAFTEIALYDVSLILNDFNITNDGKENYLIEKEILKKQLRILRVQKRIYEKLNTALNSLEDKLKKTKEINMKKELEDSKIKYRESYDVLQYLRLDESMIDQFFIKPLNLLEFQLVLDDMQTDEKISQNYKSIYDKIITRMHKNEVFEHNKWPQNCQDTLIMLNEEITNKAKLFNLDHIVVRCEDYNAEMSKSMNFSIKNFIDLYTSLLSQREDSDKKILRSPIWMAHFLVTKLKFSPLYLVSLYSDIFNILRDKVSSDSNLHITNCIFILLRHSITYISDILSHHADQTRDLITLRNSISTLEKILENFSNDGMKVIREHVQNENEIVQYHSQFLKIQDELGHQISQIEQLDGDYQQRNDTQLLNITGDSQEMFGRSSAKNNIVFNFEQDIKKGDYDPLATYKRMPQKQQNNNSLNDPIQKYDQQFMQGGQNNNNNNNNTGIFVNDSNSRQRINLTNKSITFGESQFFDQNSSSNKQNNSTQQYNLSSNQRSTQSLNINQFPSNTHQLRPINQISEAKSEEEEEIILEKRTPN